MATIGLTFFLEGFGELLWGSNVKKLDVGIPNKSFEVGGILLNQFDLFAAVTAAVLVGVLAVFFHKTSVGRALRAVADDHQAALSVGIPLKTIWVIVWSRWLYIGTRRHYRWVDHRGGRKDCRNLLGTAGRRRHRELVCIHAGAGVLTI
jgi:branched-chain amino acid transport system permease protein